MPDHLAIYIRLSAADHRQTSDKIESETISGQRALAHAFLDNHPEFADWTVHEYVDDGYSGTNDNRPQFQQMIKDVQSRLIKLIIVKDFSRFSRDYILTGDYLEQIFPFLGVRFISITDNYDSEQNTDYSDSITVVLKSIMNSYYSRELSAKMFSSYNQLMYSPDYHGFPSYGYTRGEDGRSIIPDPESAKVVRRIYDLALQGSSFTQIAKILNDAGTLTPAEYALKKRAPEKAAAAPKKYWHESSVRYILRYRTYVGDLVMHKDERTGPCSGHSRRLKPSEYVIRENDHEGIVTREEFALVQKLYPVKTIKPRQNKPFALKSRLRCGLCGKMLKAEQGRKRCRCRDSRIVQSPCFGAVYPVVSVYGSVLSTAKAAFPLILAEDASAAKRKSHAPNAIKQIDADLRDAQDAKQALLQKKADLYETYIAGSIAVCLYMEEKSILLRQSAELGKRITALNEERDSYAYATVSTDLRKAAQAARKYGNAGKLTYEMAEDLVDAVYLYPDGLQVKWKYHALFERFAPESVKRIPYYEEQEEQ